MTEPEQPQVCGAAHPSLEDITCSAPVGPNAETSPVYQTDDNGRLVLDEDGNPIELEPARPVHVHRGYAEDGGSHRWEDPPAEQ